MAPATGEHPHLQIVRGDATPEEIAALVAVLGAIQPAAAPARRPRSAWSDPARAVRRPLPHGRGGWRASGLPR